MLSSMELFLKISFLKIKIPELLIIRIFQSQKILESVIHLNLFQELNSLQWVDIPKIFSSSLVMLMVYFHQFPHSLLHRLCTISSQDTLLKQLELKQELRNPKPHSQLVSVRHSFLFTPLSMLKCLLKKFNNMVLVFG